ncbi:SNF1-related protein kinase regulatory subunit gamma-like PV42a [Vigna radiata var. radiata]|uniref:SNF1-related protein kinase regulatory subunit gamma-like PV42a n=1 Tax=Vigna radiata var. radiata TaxID=3916 RepID=A0A1S3T7S2_VIGRR|nr:SNF1-related protein kinase regulatory subunit gamma-like PV42a [Vigna radiata var. radiata]
MSVLGTHFLLHIISSTSLYWESAFSYQILTQMDMLKLLHGRVGELHSILSRSVQDLGADTVQIYAITNHTKVVYAIKCLKVAMLNVVPIVRAGDVGQGDHKQLINGRCRKLIGTFSTTDLRGCHITSLKSWLGISALAFTEEVESSPLYSESDMQNRGSSRRELVTCYAESPLSEVNEKAVTNPVHRVWVVNQEGLPVGLVSLTDVIRVIRHSLLSDSNDQ